MRYWSNEITASWLDLLVVTVAVLLILKCFLNNVSHNLPPGPRPLPMFGNILQIRNKPHLALDEMRKTYGDVFTIRIFSRLAVVVSGRRLTTLCLNAQSALFAGRPELPTSRYVLKGKSLVIASNMSPDMHKKFRSQAMWAMREISKTKACDLLNGNTPNECCPEATATSAVQDVISNGKIPFIEKELIDEFMKLGNHLAAVDAHENFNAEILSTVSILNAFLLLGTRYKRGDPELDELVQMVGKLQAADQQVALFNFLPWTQKIWSRGLDRFIGLNKDLENMLISSGVRQKVETSNTKPHRPPKSVMEVLMKTSSKNDDEAQERSILSVGDLFGAGTDTMSVAYTWIVVYAATFQQEQVKMREDIEAFFKVHARLPMYSERGQVPVVMSFITETLRHSSFVPFTVPHAPVADTTLDGFHIPQGTITLISLWSVNHDPFLWERSEEFRPERFMLPDGRFHQSLAEQVIAFGSGKRRCAGEFLARLQMFFFTIALVHNFTFRRISENEQLPDTVQSLSIKPKTIDVVTRRLQK